MSIRIHSIIREELYFLWVSEGQDTEIPRGKLQYGSLVVPYFRNPLSHSFVAPILRWRTFCKSYPYPIEITLHTNTFGLSLKYNL